MKRSTLQLLRFHFSLFLLPVFLFALSAHKFIDWQSTILAFIILHLLVYPSSNGYNSYMDRDTTSIGGLKTPLQPTRQLFIVSVCMDIAAVALSLLISLYFAGGILLYILASRAYSFRGIRLKKFPVPGYMVVVICQGALVYFLAYHGSGIFHPINVSITGMAAATCLIGGYYPLTQVYQHREDRLDGVTTISYVLGKRGTFVFSAAVFTLATICMFIFYREKADLFPFWLFLFCMLPMVWFFVIWMMKVWKNEAQANFKNSLLMNVLAAACTTVCFTVIIIYQNL